MRIMSNYITFICEQIVEIYGGSIEFNYDKKVTVTIKIPKNKSDLETFW